jgi:signal peptidase II
VADLGRRRWGIVGATVAVVLVLDQLTKWWAVRTLCDPRGETFNTFCDEGRGRVIDLVGSLRFNYAENTGMAFSAGRSAGPLIALVATAIVVVLLVVARRLTSRFQLVLVGVVVGGAVGNLLDRILRARNGPLSGGVVDFIDLQWWPIFNVADACVVVGGIALALASLRAPDPDPGQEPEADPEPESAGEIEPAGETASARTAEADPEPERAGEAGSDGADPT